MKNIVLLALCTTSLLTAGMSHAHETDDDYERVSRVVDLAGFDKIRMEGVYHMDVTVGDKFSINLSGRDREMSRTELYLDGDTLVLDQNRKEKKVSFNNWKGVEATITLPALYDVTVEGVGKGEFENIDAKKFDIHVEGVGEFIFEGQCDKLSVTLEGVGEVDARGLECKDVTADLEGMGAVSVYASKSIDADAEGIGSIDVFGKPDRVEKSKDFLSSVEIK